MSTITTITPMQTYPISLKPAADNVPQWKVLAEEKRRSVAAKIPQAWRLPSSTLADVSPTSTRNVLDIPRECGILTEKELDITERHDATELVEMLATREISSLEVTTAFCKRAAIAGQLTNCLTEIFFEEALERARLLDRYIATEGKPMGPLHGLPISVKESFCIKGVDSTIGFVSFIGRPAPTHNAALVDILLSQGAVLYVKTNVPQTMMTADSENNIFGRTLNPHNLSLTAGGSSGGEGALIALRGSVLGVGTDIAGSVRIPAFCNGTFGFRPTAGRLPYGGQMTAGRAGMVGILPAAGPLAHNVRDMELLMSAVLYREEGNGVPTPWELDETAMNVPWRQVGPALETRRLRLGLIQEDPAYPLHPPALRSIASAAKKLEAAGHTVVRLDGKISCLRDCARLAWQYFALDPAKTSISHVHTSGEPVIASIPTTRFPDLDDFRPGLSELFDMNVQRRRIVAAFRKLVVENEIDAIVMPMYQAGTAVKHDQYGLPPYTVLANLIDFPAATIPYLSASQELDAPFVRDDAMYQPTYDPQAVEGAPSAVQVMGLPMRDEELVKILSNVTRALESKL